eukprot:scaffold55034_cov61-Phaeocystis_antarctica.AAC.1
MSPRPPIAHNRHPGGLRAPLGCLEPPCAVGLYVRGGPPKTWRPASSNMLRAFALSSAASSMRLTRGGGTVPSQGKASEAALLGARRGSSKLVGRGTP